MAGNYKNENYIDTTKKSLVYANTQDSDRHPPISLLLRLKSGVFNFL